MKTNSYRISIFFILISQLLQFSCKKEDVDIEVFPRTLLSVNLNTLIGQSYNKWYMAAYSPQGDLLGIGSLTDSSNWSLISNYSGSKIDIVMYQVYYDYYSKFLNVTHFKDWEVGHVFSNETGFKCQYLNSNLIAFNGNKSHESKIKNYDTITKRSSVRIMLKVEDFGNRIDENTATCPYESWPYIHKRGIAYPYGEVIWDEIKDGYTYKLSYFDKDPSYQGFELTLLERGTNKPFMHYNNIDLSNFSDNDTITINKSDFVEGNLNTIKVTMSNNDLGYIYMYVYNSESGKKDLLTSFDTANPDDEKKVMYFTSPNLPIGKWKLNYFSLSGTSLLVESNDIIPTSVDAEELMGQRLVDMSDSKANSYQLTHSNFILNQDFKRSHIQFQTSTLKNISYSYEMVFDVNQSVGTTTFKLHEIPNVITSEFLAFHFYDNPFNWDGVKYSHTYSNSLGETPMEYLNSMLGIPTSTKSNYTKKTYSLYF